jgi:hypothetical protein
MTGGARGGGAGSPLDERRQLQHCEKPTTAATPATMSIPVADSEDDSNGIQAAEPITQATSPAITAQTSRGRSTTRRASNAA